MLVYKVFVVCLFSCCDEKLIAHTALQFEIGAVLLLNVDVVNKLETAQIICNTCHCKQLHKIVQILVLLEE